MSTLDGRPYSASALLARIVEAWRIGVHAVIRSVDPSPSDAWLADGQIKLYRQATRYATLIIPVGAFFVAEACEPWVPRAVCYTWWGVMLAICAGLDLGGRYLEKHEERTVAGLRRITRAYVAMNTVFLAAWCSMSVFLWAPGEPINHMMIILVLACSFAGSIAITSVHPASTLNVFIIHAVFIVAPPALSPYPLDHTLAGMACVFLLLMAGQAVALNVSMTKMITLEHERTGLVDGLQQAKDESDRERTRATMASKAKSQFLSNMNHELRTPMNAILGFSELMRDTAYRATPEKCAEYAGIIHDSGKNLLALIDDMLDLAKIEGGKLYLRECEFSFAHLLSEAVNDIEAEAEAKGVSVVRKIARGLPQVLADERGLRQIATNLLTNAVKFTQPGGCVTAFAQVEADGALTFGVEDTGIGIAEEDQAHVFERFGHGRHDVATADKGTGLGLAIVKGFAEAHDGAVRLESEIGVGTRVTVTLPKDRVVAIKSAVA